MAARTPAPAVRHYRFPAGWGGYLLGRWHWLPLLGTLGPVLVVLLGLPGFAGKLLLLRLGAGLLILAVFWYCGLELRAYLGHRRLHGAAVLRIGAQGLSYGSGLYPRGFTAADVRLVLHVRSTESKLAPMRPLGYCQLWLRSGETLLLSTELVPAGDLRAALPAVPWETETKRVASLPDAAAEPGC